MRQAADDNHICQGPARTSWDERFEMELAVGRGLAFALTDGWVTGHQQPAWEDSFKTWFRAEFLQKALGSLPLHLHPEPTSPSHPFSPNPRASVSPRF